MGKKSKQKQTMEAPAAKPAGEPIARLGWMVIGAGALCVLCGFVALSKADPMGKNRAAGLAPFLILGGYALIGGGIFAPSEPPANP